MKHAVFKRSFFSLALIAALLAAPIAAEALAGGGGSFGSRGMRSFSAPPATPTAPRTAAPLPRQPSAGSQGFAQSPAAAPARSGFGRGLAGGLLGAGLFGLLLGAGFAGGLGSLTSILGLLLQVILVVVAVRFVMGLFANRRQQAMAGNAPRGYAAAGGSGLGPRPQAQAANNNAANTNLAITPTDYAAFEQRLQTIQQAYSNEDVGGLRQLAMPDIAAQMADEIQQNTRQGVANRITGTHLLQGDLAEAWQEDNREFASVAMRFGAIDTMVDRTTGHLVSGDPTKPVEATEIWTFQRPRNAGPDAWRLSAIQQAA